jgi:hypothetical protein
VITKLTMLIPVILTTSEGHHQLRQGTSPPVGDLDPYLQVSLIKILIPGSVEKLINR